MHRLDTLHLAHPFAGSRMLIDLLRLEGFSVGRKHVRNLSMTRPNQGWVSNVTYIPMANGFVYLTVILDWYSRRALAWGVSVTMDVECIMEALEEAIEKYGCPAIMNTDQGNQYTSAGFTQTLKERDIHMSVDSQGPWREDVCVERLRRSAKYEDICKLPRQADSS
jgi:putative transposase